MARGEDIEIFSLSLLDLVFCAMAGVVVLYSVADPEGRQYPYRKPPPSTVTVTIMDAQWTSVPFRVRLTNGVLNFDGSSKDPKEWIFKDGTATVVVRDALKSNATLSIRIVDFPLSDWPSASDEVTIQVGVESVRTSAPPQRHRLRLASSYEAIIHLQ